MTPLLSRRLAIAFLAATASSLPFPEHRFDVVTSTLMVHHLRTPEKQRMLAEVRRVLSREGGLFSGDSAGLQLAIETRSLLFHHGSIRGALPQLVVDP